MSLSENARGLSSEPTVKAPSQRLSGKPRSIRGTVALLAGLAAGTVVQPSHAQGQGTPSTLTQLRNPYTPKPQLDAKQPVALPSSGLEEPEQTLTNPETAAPSQTPEAAISAAAWEATQNLRVVTARNAALEDELSDTSQKLEAANALVEALKQEAARQDTEMQAKEAAYTGAINLLGKDREKQQATIVKLEEAVGELEKSVTSNGNKLDVQQKWQGIVNILTALGLTLIVIGGVIMLKRKNEGAEEKVILIDAKFIPVPVDPIPADDAATREPVNEQTPAAAAPEQEDTTEESSSKPVQTQETQNSVDEGEAAEESSAEEQQAETTSSGELPPIEYFVNTMIEKEPADWPESFLKVWDEYNKGADCHPMVANYIKQAMILYTQKRLEQGMPEYKQSLAATQLPSYLREALYRSNPKDELGHKVVKAKRAAQIRATVRAAEEHEDDPAIPKDGFHPRPA